MSGGGGLLLLPVRTEELELEVGSAVCRLTRLRCENDRDVSSKGRKERLPNVDIVGGVFPRSTEGPGMALALVDADVFVVVVEEDEDSTICPVLRCRMRASATGGLSDDDPPLLVLPTPSVSSSVSPIG